MNIILPILLGYLFYRFFARRLKRRVVRVFLMISVLVPLVLLVMGDGNQVQRLSPEEIEARILDSAYSERADLVVAISAAGTIAPARQAPLIFGASAPVLQVFVQEGSDVASGDLIARLDPQDPLQTLAEAELTLRLQQAYFDFLTAAPREVDLAAANAALNAALAQINAASSRINTDIQSEIARLQYEIAGNRVWQSQLQRDAIPGPSTLPSIPLPQTGFEPVDNFLDTVAGFISSTNQQQIDALAAQRRQLETVITQAEYAQQIAEATWNSTEIRGPDAGALSAAAAARLQAEIALQNLLEGPDEISLNRSMIDLRLAELAVEQAEYNLRQYELRAPFSGIVAQNNLTVGQIPPQGVSVLLMDVNTFYVELPVDEVDVVRVQVGQRVEFDVDALPDVVLSGQVERLAYTPLNVGQLSAYLVRVRLDPTDAPIRVGMSVTARIIVNERNGVVLAPNRFIRIDRLSGDSFVIVQESDGTFVERMILLGERNERQSEIRAGLEPGERLVLLPSDADAVGFGFFRQRQ